MKGTHKQVSFKAKEFAIPVHLFSLRNHTAEMSPE
jgi:hypothetical protein